MRKLLYVLVLAMSLHDLYAQEGNIWYFGNKAGINFNNNPPSVLLDGEMEAREGSAAVCDANGNLLFYSNGTTVFNRNRGIMDNGENLMGNVSSVQACMIARMPGSDSIYYLFTADAFENNYENGYRYSIVNMKRDNGLGAVTSKNILFSASGTERLTMARHRNGVDIWIIVNDNSSNVFRAFLLTCNGFQESSPVVSTAGAAMDNDRFLNVGMMKISPDGSQLCQTNFMVDNTPFFQLLDFDNQTGVISGGFSVVVPGMHYFGCEFSPGSEFLYMTSGFNSSVDQFRAKAGTAAAVVSSRIPIPAPKSVTGIQLAPDGRIYLCNASPRLSVIHFPDREGVDCSLRIDEINLYPATALQQLPGFLNDVNFDPYNNFSTEVIDTCGGVVRFNGFSSLPAPLQWNWDFGDGATATEQHPVHQFNPADQEYTVTLSVSSGVTCSRSFRVRRPVSPRGIPDRIALQVVERCDSGYVRFVNLSAGTDIPGNQFTWDFGDGTVSQELNPIHIYTTSGTYRVKLKRSGLLPCLDDSTSTDLVYRTFSLSVSPAQSILAGQPVQVFAHSSEPASFTWMPTNTLVNAEVFNPVALPLEDTWYRVTATSLNGCIAIDSIFIRVRPVENIFVPTAFTPNGDGLNDEIRPFFPLGLRLARFSIYNRWGEQVFMSNARGQGWDGRLKGRYQQAGVYVWHFVAIDEMGKKIDRKGTLLLMR